MINRDVMSRLLELEAVCSDVKEQWESTLTGAYDVACTNEDEEAAASILRKLRNKKLAESDSYCTLDRILSAVNGGNIADVIGALISAANNDWGKYRQALRDLPSQEGFPFNVDFPSPPKEA